MPHAKFLSKSYVLAISRYHWARQFAKGKTVLDAGCGAGYGANILARHGAKKVYGVDIEPEAINYSHAHYRRNNIVFSRGDLAKLDFPDKYFDTIIAFEVIEHTKDIAAVLTDFYRLLKPGGKLVVSTPNKAVYSPGTKKPFYPFHERELYLDDLKKALAKFHVVSLLGQYIKDKPARIPPVWHPKRNAKILYANLPLRLKKAIAREYLNVRFWLYRAGLRRPKTADISDIVFSKKLESAPIFIAVCQKELINRNIVRAPAGARTNTIYSSRITSNHKINI